MKRLPTAQHPGWDRDVDVAPHQVRFYPDGSARFFHLCDRGERGIIKCDPLLQLSPEGSGHRIEQEEPLTIAPSILCTDCGTHGFVRNGIWEDCS